MISRLLPMQPLKVSMIGYNQLIAERTGLNPIRIFSSLYFMKLMFTAECIQNSWNWKTYDRYRQTHGTMRNNSTKDGSIRA